MGGVLAAWMQLWMRQSLSCPQGTQKAGEGNRILVLGGGCLGLGGGGRRAQKKVLEPRLEEQGRCPIACNISAETPKEELPGKGLVYSGMQ